MVSDTTVNLSCVTEGRIKMARRTGLWTLQKIAQNLCRAVATFTPAIQAVYGSNATLMAALTAANEACRILSEEIEAEREYGD